MRVLHTFENRELAPRTEMDLEFPAAIDDVVVDPLGVLSVGFAARLPATLEDLARIGSERGELRDTLSQSGTHKHTGEKPGKPGRS